MALTVPRRLLTAVALFLTLPLIAAAIQAPGGDDAAPGLEAPSSATPTGEAPPPSPAGTKRARAEQPDKPTAGPPRSLYLAIGHGRTPEGRVDPGSRHPQKGVREVDTAAIMVRAMAKVLADTPGLHLWVEQPGKHANVHGSVATANRLRADDCIEIHQEWAGAPPGAFAHWYPTSNGAKRLGDRMVTSLREIGIPTRGDWHRPRPGLMFVRKTSCRAVLMEVGRVGDFNRKQLAAAGRAMAHAYLEDIGRR